MKIHDYKSGQSTADDKRLQNSLIKAKFSAPVSCKNWYSKNPFKTIQKYFLITRRWLV